MNLQILLDFVFFLRIRRDLVDFLGFLIFGCFVSDLCGFVGFSTDSHVFFCGFAFLVLIWQIFAVVVVDFTDSHYQFQVHLLRDFV